MKVLLVNAKPTLADALAACADVEVGLLWPRQHDFARVPPPTRVTPQYYDGGTKMNLRAAWQLRKILRAQRPDIVHAFYGRALSHTVLGAQGLQRRPQIVSFRGIVSPLSRLDAGDWLSYRHPLVAAHACESDAVRDALIRSGIEEDRCWTTFNSMFNVPTRRPGRVGLAQFNIPADAFVVGTMAAMRPVKRIDLLLQAAIECADLRDTFWILFGDVLDDSIQTLVDDRRIRDRVRLVGHRADAAELISGADVFVMPSRAEALCQALLEAMYQGVCPVVTDAGGMKEVVRHRQDGLVVPTENAVALAAAIRTLHADRQLVKRISSSARERIADTFTPYKMAERTLAIYRQLLAADPDLAAA
jgi:glycosyltransferase involved in cell wall biosynthesis